MNNKTILIRTILLAVVVGIVYSMVLNLVLSQLVVIVIVGGICLAITVWWVKPLEGISERTRIVYGLGDHEEWEEE